MKIRVGYITNSSSTNFMIVSKNELTVDYLYEKLGFKKKSLLNQHAKQLCNDIINGTFKGLRWFDFDEMDESDKCKVRGIFGEKAARIYESKKAKGFYIYMGHTGSDENPLTCFFTIDSFEIDEKDFYLNARDCTW